MPLIVPELWYHIKDEDMEAAKQFILDVLKIRSVAPEAKPQINEEVRGENIKKKTNKKISIDEEIKELLAQPTTEKGGYVHKCGDRRKIAKAV